MMTLLFLLGKCFGDDDDDDDIVIVVMMTFS